MMTKYLIPFLLFFSFSIVVSAASFEEGRDAYLAKDYEKALSILKPLATKGHAKAQVTLGIMYDFGHGVDKDSSTAVEWYEKAAGQGNSSVQHDLGVKYFKGMGIPQNYNKAAAWWRMAAENGVAESQYNLGLMHARGLGFEKNSGKAINWYSKAASQGHPHAQYSLGVMYSFGQGVTQNYAKGLSYFQDAAEQNNAQAQYNLAVLLENGRGTDVDMVGAKKWYQRASDNGIEQATQRLASFDGSQQTEPQTTPPANSESTTAIAETDANVPASSTKPTKTGVVTTPESISATAKMEELDQDSDSVAVKIPATNSAVAKVEVPEVPTPNSDQTVSKHEELKIPETEITQVDRNNSSTQVAPPTNHQVISGTVLEEPPTLTKKNAPVAKSTSPESASKTTAGYSKTGHQENWINSQPPQGYTLQMVAVNQKEGARRYMESLEMDGDRAMYKSSMHGKTIYKVIYGSFVDHKAALKGRRELPAKYRDAKPFPKSFESIQNEFLK